MSSSGESEVFSGGFVTPSRKVGDETIVDIETEEERDISEEEMAPPPRAANVKGRIKREIQALTDDIEEELEYDESTASDVVEIDTVVKGLKELRFKLLGKIGELEDIEDTSDKATSTELLVRVKEKISAMKKKIGELNKAASESKAEEVAKTATLKENEEQIII